MEPQSTEDFLTKQIMIDGNIITYRSLSRRLSLHVNAAKNALATFYSKVKRDGESKLAATYLVSGELQPDLQTSNAMDVDTDNFEENMEYDDDGAEEVQLVEVVLVGEKDLEYTKSKFSKIYSTHIYSLSPASIRDMGLICGPNETVREIDNKKGSEMAAIVGKMIGNVKEGKGKPYVPAPPPAVATSTISGSKSFASASTENRPTKKNSTTSEKPKASDFFAKAKPKDAKDVKEPTKKETKKSSASEESDQLKPRPTASTSKDSNGLEKLPKADPKRNQDEQIKSSKAKGKAVANKTGAKRKLPNSESEEEEAEKLSVRVKKHTIVSDEEEQVTTKVGRTKGKAKSKQVVGREDDDVLALMDIDDDQVIRASRSRRASPEPSEAVKSEPKDVDMQDDTEDKPAIKAKQRKTKAKKVVPIGKNGLKKKRVMRSKVTTDAKGYMVTEDYSSYESVGEEETEPEPAKGTSRQSKVSGSKAKKEEEEERQEDNEATSTNIKPPPKPKQKAMNPSNRGPGGGTSGQKNIASFFGKPKGNK
ncbi:DNA polymerase subunit Cdc27 [Lentinula detonsa]|uniref:DNA polymerase delta subunit 3 n=1 Tax=Lentinula detonsa TaxID=2804962 RepID=A0AA38Q8P2_9AGAR|nr:DNA polymerase subunit Cdc27 [Lentinula detonsa]